VKWSCGIRKTASQGKYISNHIIDVMANMLGVPNHIIDVMANMLGVSNHIIDVMANMLGVSNHIIDVMANMLGVRFDLWLGFDTPSMLAITSMTWFDYTV
jgi:plasmid maintenance system antidote protein VapI